MKLHAMVYIDKTGKKFKKMVNNKNKSTAKKGICKLLPFFFS